jgi:hypothetical protein
MVLAHSLCVGTYSNDLAGSHPYVQNKEYNHFHILSSSFIRSSILEIHTQVYLSGTVRWSRAMGELPRYNLGAMGVWENP